MDFKANAKKIDSLLSVKSLADSEKTKLAFLKIDLNKAIIVNRSGFLQKMIKTMPANSLKEKGYSLKSLLEESKEVKNARQCQENFCFRLAHLEKIYEEPLLKKKSIKRLHEFSLKQELSSLRLLTSIKMKKVQHI